MKKEQFKKRPSKKDFPKKGYQEKQQVKTSQYYDLFGLAVIILLGIIVYSNSFSCSFHFDDLYDIVNNTKIRNLSDIKAWWNDVPSRPLGSLTFALNYHFNKLDVLYWHIVNLVIHLINACLVWWLTLLIFSSPSLKDHPVTRQKKVIAFFTALLFVSHPLSTQSVTYIVQRLASMVAMFYLLSLSLYVKARLMEKSNTLKYTLFASSFISAVAAMLTKENAFTLPFTIVLFELFFLRTKKILINFRDWRVILLTAAFMVIIIIIPLKFSFSIFNPIFPTQTHTYTVTPLNYLLTQFSVIVKYIQLLFLPINQRLEYDFPISNYFFEIRTLLNFLILLSLFILAIFIYKKYRTISFGIFWFFLTLSIESSFIPIPNVIFEHRTYLPSFGFFLVLSAGLFLLFRTNYKIFPFVILTIIIVLNSYLTYERNKVWKDEISLLSDNIAKTPDLARPYNNRGAIYESQRQSDKAITDFSNAIGINPKFSEAYYNRGATYRDLKQWDKAIADFSTAIKIDPNYTIAYYNRGVAYARIGQPDRAISDYSSTIMLDPDYTDAYYNRSAAYVTLKKWNNVIVDCSKVIALNPDYSKAFYNRGIAYTSLGQWEKAIADYSRGIVIDPNYTDAYYNRGVAYGSLGQWGKAIDDFTRTVDIDPNYSRAYSNRAFAESQLRRVKK